ncbi:unnamed protein product [Adineta steineri]|uniref:UBC core domain-containing protein n=1 Tax=Adineta steineri TaxID=433720 RepID=A0A815IIE2_9BILA|nr:unnamed protein product [Adineta steineri]CAF3966775.1 unnamed protein product [Adineta steineri]
MLNTFRVEVDPDDRSPRNVGRNNTSAALLRVTKELSEIDTLPPTCQVTYPNQDDLLHFTLTITPDDGFYKGGRFVFSFTIESEYPHRPPKVKCTQKIYHPNIDLEGNVCLNILREDWNPVLTISSVILGMGFLFSNPNPHDPLNKEAAEVLKTNENTFQSNVTKTMAGGTLNGVQFDRVLVR